MFFIILLLILGGLCLTAWFAKGLFIDGRGQHMPGIQRLARIITTTLLALLILWNSFIVVSVGHVAVGKFLGTVHEKTYSEGPHLVNPFYDFHEMKIRRQIIEFQSSKQQPADGEENTTARGDVVAVSSDNLPLTVDVTYVWSMNPRFASWLYRKIGNEETYTEQLVVQAARSASRSATAQFNYAEATTSNRDGLAKKMEEEFRSRLIEDMVRQGLPRQDAAEVFNVLPVQLRKVLPPERVLNAIAEKISSEQDLQRQAVLTKIATQEALRRGQEGEGVKKLFEALPTGFTAGEISTILNAIANKERADAQMRAVTTNKVSVIVMDGTPAVSVSGK